MKNKYYLALPALAFLGACSKSPPPETAMSKEMFEYKTEQVVKQIEQMPKWYTDIPKKDDAVYAVGTSETPDLQLSIDMAVLSAKTTLADRVDSRIRSQLKMFKSKIGGNDFDSSIQNEFEQATRNIIADADVAGYTVKESQIVPNGTQYRAYVLLEYKNDEANRVIKTRLASNEELYAKLRATVAFKELDNAVEAQKEAESAEVQEVIELMTSTVEE